jgi:hypothetical protein
MAATIAKAQRARHIFLRVRSMFLQLQAACPREQELAIKGSRGCGKIDTSSKQNVSVAATASQTTWRRLRVRTECTLDRVQRRCARGRRRHMRARLQRILERPGAVTRI